MNKFGGRHGCDELISVGEAPFVVLWKHGKPVVYSNGLQLKNKMSDDLTFVETIRIREGTIEYCFSIDGIESKWSSSRQAAFLECVEKAKKTLPAKRCVILGPSQEAVQKAILAKYPHILSSLDEPLSQAAPSTQITPKKTVSWGDEMDKVVEEPDTEHRYGGWGLLAYKTIPNREELLAQMRTWSDLVMDSEDIDEFASLDDDEAELMFSNEMRSYSIFEDEPLIGSPTLTAHKRPVPDDDKTVYNGSGDDETEDGDADNEEEVKEQTSSITKKIDIREPVTEDSSNDSDSSEDTTDEDEEGGASRSDVSQLRKRIRVSPSSAHQEKRFDSNNSVCLSVDTSQEASRPTLNSPITCKPVEDGLKECDFLWLNDQIF